MTEYGRGQGPQPWHPEDPLYGDRGWDGTQQTGWDAYDNQPQPSHHDPHQSDAGGWHPSGGYQGPYDHQLGEQSQGQYHQEHQDPYGQGQFAYGQYENNGQQHSYPHESYGHGTPYPPGSYDTGHYGAGHYGSGEHDVGSYDSGQPNLGQYHEGGQYTPGQQYPSGAYDAQAYQGAADAYGQQTGYESYPGQPDPYGTATQAPYAAVPQEQDSYGGAPQDPYTHARPTVERRPDPEAAAPEWDSDEHLEDHSFFADDSGGAPRPGRAAGRDDGDKDDKPADTADDADDGEGRARGRSRGGPRRKNGMACVLVTAALVGGVGGVGYFGYQYYQSHFSSAPDFEGQGSGEVQVEIPANSSLSDMGNILRRAGVVKSHDAFVEASRENAKAQEIHAGSYILRKEMSAAAAIELMLDPASQGGLIIPEGLRATRIYEMIDKKTESTKGTTEKVAEEADLGLPDWADGEPEGFLFPSKYSVSEKSDPEDVLREMVKRAKAEFKKIDFEDSARKVNHSPREVLTIASLIQAEAQSDDEFGKVSRVVYNRLKPGNSATNGKLDFDSTINYALGRSTLDVSVNDTKLDHPYNTYRHAGLPPGPIDNPGHQAIEAALKPTKGDWLYFVTVRPGDTRFSETFEEHTRHVREFNEEQRRKREEDG